MYMLCKKCNEEKHLIEFYKWRRVCKTCDLLQKKEYRNNNKEKIYLKSKEWYLKTKNLRKKHKNNYYKNKRKNDNLFKLTSGLRRNIRNSFIRNGFAKNSKTQEIIGCSFDDFKVYIESKFENWMNWNNKGLYNGTYNFGWDIDHIIPISAAATEEDIIKLNHYTNLQPLCSKKNRDIKNSKI